MSNIDELSHRLGVIQSDIEHIKTHTTNIESKLDQSHELAIENKSANKAAHKRLDEIQPHVESYKRMEQRGIGLIAVLAFIVTLIGNGILKVIGAFVN